MQKFFICVYIYFLHLKSNFRSSSLSFVKINLGRNTNKLAIAINWQNFAQFRLQFNFAFRIRPLSFSNLLTLHYSAADLLVIKHNYYES